MQYKMEKCSAEQYKRHEYKFCFAFLFGVFRLHDNSKERV